MHPLFQMTPLHLSVPLVPFHHAHPFHRLHLFHLSGPSDRLFLSGLLPPLHLLLQSLPLHLLGLSDQFVLLDLVGR